MKRLFPEWHAGTSHQSVGQHPWVVCRENGAFHFKPKDYPIQVTQKNAAGTVKGAWCIPGGGVLTF